MMLHSRARCISLGLKPWAMYVHFFQESFLSILDLGRWDLDKLDEKKFRISTAFQAVLSRLCVLSGQANPQGSQYLQCRWHKNSEVKTNKNELVVHYFLESALRMGGLAHHCPQLTHMPSMHPAPTRGRRGDDQSHGVQEFCPGEENLTYAVQFL